MIDMKIINVIALFVVLLCAGCTPAMMNTVNQVVPTAVYGETYIPGYVVGWEMCVGRSSEGVVRFTWSCSHQLAPQEFSVLAGKDTYAVDVYGNRYPVSVEGDGSRKMAAGVAEKFTLVIKGIPPGANAFSMISCMVKTSTDGVGGVNYHTLRFRNIPITW